MDSFQTDRRFILVKKYLYCLHVTYYRFSAVFHVNKTLSQTNCRFLYENNYTYRQSVRQ